MCDLEWSLRKIHGQWFLKCRKNGEIRLSNDSDAVYRVPGCIISVRHTYSCTRALTYLLTYLHSWIGRIKPAISPKRLKVERKLVLTAYIKSYTGFRLPPKCMTLNDLWARFKVIDSFFASGQLHIVVLVSVFILWIEIPETKLELRQTTGKLISYRIHKHFSL